MWQFEYDVKLDNEKAETFKYEGASPSREEVWKRADQLGTVVSIHWRILVDGKPFKEGDFPRTHILHTLAEAVAYLDAAWKKAEQKTVS